MCRSRSDPYLTPAPLGPPPTDGLTPRLRLRLYLPFRPLRQMCRSRSDPYLTPAPLGPPPTDGLTPRLRLRLYLPFRPLRQMCRSRSDPYLTPAPLRLLPTDGRELHPGFRRHCHPLRPRCSQGASLPLPSRRQHSPAPLKPQTRHRGSPCHLPFRGRHPPRPF